jgi:DNA-binding transcriptional LysR family regulator
MNKFEDMQSFVRIVEAGSITKAANQLNIAKSAMSKRLSNLESRLGITLLNRTTRSLILTDNGKAYYNECKRIIDDVVEVEASLQNKQTALSGSIKVAVPLSFGLLHLAPAINEFNRLHPEIRFEIDFNDRKISLINEGYDLAIRVGKLDDSNLMARKITSIKTLLVASQDYLDEHGTPLVPADLLHGHNKLHYSNISAVYHFNDEKGQKIQINLPSTIISNNGDYLSKCALEGLGIISTPDFISYKEINSGRLIPLLTKFLESPEIGVNAIYPQTRHLSRKIRSLIDFLVDYFGESPLWSLN